MVSKMKQDYFTSSSSIDCCAGAFKRWWLEYLHLQEAADFMRGQWYLLKFTVSVLNNTDIHCIVWKRETQSTGRCREDESALTYATCWCRQSMMASCRPPVKVSGPQPSANAVHAARVPQHANSAEKELNSLQTFRHPIHSAAPRRKRHLWFTALLFLYCCCKLRQKKKTHTSSFSCCLPGKTHKRRPFPLHWKVNPASVVSSLMILHPSWLLLLTMQPPKLGPALQQGAWKIWSNYNATINCDEGMLR